MSGPTFSALNCWRTVLTHVGVGMGAASFWRGAWYVLDDQLFPEDPNLSAVASLALGTGGMAASQGIVARAMAVQGRYLKPVARFGALYTIAMSCVLVWRGTWVGWDCVYEKLLNSKTTVLVGHDQQQQQKQQQHTAENANKKREKEEPSSVTTLALPSISSSTASDTTSSSPLSTTSSLMATSSSFIEHSPAHAVIKSTDPGHLTTSGMVSHVFAIGALGACGVFASVLAPPAAVSVIKDLAIKVSRPAASGAAAKGAAPSFQRTTTKQALEYVPHLAGYIRTSTTRPSSAATTTPSRSMFTTAKRGFQSSTFASRSMFTTTAPGFPSSTFTNKATWFY